uniref:Nodulation signaling pathway 1-like protein n=1 Tax=Crambe hispanica subsp. abyssinica TaxID=3721 RepID=J7HG79_CRAAB|nr:nodulation signaling pathway 1-like protein [Crambe hispanica subsp. abyssinica]
MSLEETEPPSQTLDNVLGWLDDSISLTPLPGFNEFDWSQTWEWDHQTQTQTQDPGFDFLDSYSQDLNAYIACEASNLEVVTGVQVTDSDPPQVVHLPNDQSKKRNRDELVDAQLVKKPSRSKKKADKSSEVSRKDVNKEERWAEQLLNPCALAITARNSSRVQHYICVLSELASSCGDANHRLASFGLYALKNHLSTSSVPSSLMTFASADVKMFQRTLLKFYEVSPWFALPNNMANSAILQILSQEPRDEKDLLHILDIGVSHGMQWPTLLEALCCRPEGPPLHVRITVVSDLTADIPFSVGPPPYNYASQLIGFARSLNINLHINVIDKFQLIDTSPHETFIVCAQFRLYQLKSTISDERSEALKALRNLNPKGVVLCEYNGEGSSSSMDFAADFSRKLDYLWKFLDSTSYGFKEENGEERKLMEGEATKVLMSSGDTSEGKEIWYERMRKAGFAAEAFGEDAVDGAKSLLRKYDNNWEIKMEDEDTFAGLLWKGEEVSFCSLWK